MLAVIGTIIAIISIGFGVLIWLAAAMSDAPGDHPSSWPVLVGLAISALCFIAYHYGW